MSAPRVTGSESLKAVRKGFVHWRSASQARLLAGAAGVFGRSRDEKGEPAGALLVGLVREGRVVGGDDVVRQVRDSLKGSRAGRCCRLRLAPVEECADGLARVYATDRLAQERSGGRQAVLERVAASGRCTPPRFRPTPWLCTYSA